MPKVEVDGATYDLDLESKIMDCWNITSDIQVLTEGVLEKDMTPDQIANVLLGLETLYQLKFERLFSDYEKLVAAKFQIK
jgi:hypothetical protein